MSFAGAMRIPWRLFRQSKVREHPLLGPYVEGLNKCVVDALAESSYGTADEKRMHDT